MKLKSTKYGSFYASDKIQTKHIGALMRRLLAIFLLGFGFSASGEDILQVYQQAHQNDPTFALSEIGNRIQKLNNYSAHTQLLPQISFRLPRGRSTNENRTTYPDEAINDPRYAFLGVTRENNGVWNERETEQVGWSANLSQTVFSVPTLINVMTSRKSTASSDYSLFSSEQALIIRVVEAYFSVLRASASLQNSLASEDAIKRQLEQAEQRYEVGLTASTDVLNARASHDDAIVSRIQAWNSFDIEFEALRVLTGATISELSGLAEDFPIQDPVPNSEEAWVEMALKNNPQVRAQEISYESAKLRHWGQLAKDLPSISLGMSYNRSEQPFNLGGQDTPWDYVSESKGFNIGLTFTASVTGGSRFVQDRISALNREQSRLQVVQQKLTVEEQVRRQFRTVVTDVLRVEARLRAIDSSQASLDATETGYEVGTRNIVEVLNAQRALFGAQLAYQNAKYDYILGMLRLKQSAGVLTAAEIEELNRFMDNEKTVTRLTTMTGRE